MKSRTNGSQLSELRLVDPHLSSAEGYEKLAARSARPLPTDLISFDTVVAGGGRMRTLHEWIADTYGTSLLVVDRGTLVYEWYADELGPDTLFLGASMTKSALAHLVGRAVTNGVLGLDDLAASYVPELEHTGYQDVTVRSLLTMTSGVDWVEDHRDSGTLASRLVGCFGDPPGDSRALLRLINARTRPGTQYEYCTADSQVLDWVRERATDLTYVEDLARLWDTLGCERDAVVGIDALRVPLAGGGLAACARDWARIGMLAVDGTSGGAGVLDEEWIDAAVRPPFRFLEPGRLPSGISTHVGFAYHWWPLDLHGRRIAADGSRGQFTYVDRAADVVIVKTSQWPYDDWLADRQFRDLSYLGLAAIGDAVVGSRT
ncbi:beta-lactamase family protein [Nocardioidaceae bacterium SCSIO 66511]|nr:beta-lactamase family protein [Nocardioidaceae bacterium SCSIO 66511]